MKLATPPIAVVIACLAHQPAFSQSAAECAVHLSPCHVDTRLPMAGIDDNRKARDFLARIKDAARSGDREKLADHVRYPLSVYVVGDETVYSTTDALLREFGQVFTPGVLKAIERAEYDTLFVNDQGAMLGDGAIWFDGWSGTVLIKTVNPPDVGTPKLQH